MSKESGNRKVLAPGSVIHLLPCEPKRLNEDKSGAGSVPERPTEIFMIDSVEGMGASAICYEAKRSVDGGKTVKRGKLKEFYPVDSDEPGRFAVHLERAAAADGEQKNQLHARFGTFPNFQLLESVYENSYAVIEEQRKGKESCPFAEDLNKYIPHYSYYRGVPAPPEPEDDELDEEMRPINTTFYVWVENEAGYQSFQDYLNGLCGSMKEANDESDYVGNRIGDLDYILRCMLDLTKGVDILHRCSLYHLDLSPRNFGVQLNAFRTDKDKPGVNLYDTNSLRYGRDPNQIVFSAGTEYFRSPEVKDGDDARCGISSDVFSLGAILYHALMIREEKGVFRNVPFGEDTKKECSKEAFDRIGADLKESELLQSSDDTRGDTLREKFVEIIRKALNRFGDPCGTYRTADEMAQDLKRALYDTGFYKWAAERPGYDVSMPKREKEKRYD